MKESPTIGILAHEAAVNVETIRYYQRIGLIAEPPRPLSGYRRYPRGAIARVRFIKRAQQLGFSLKEIRELLDLGDGCCVDARKVAEDKRARVQAQIDDLLAVHAVLNELILACQDTEDTPRCALIEALSDRRANGRSASR